MLSIPTVDIVLIVLVLNVTIWELKYFKWIGHHVKD